MILVQKEYPEIYGQGRRPIKRSQLVTVGEQRICSTSFVKVSVTPKCGAGKQTRRIGRRKADSQTEGGPHYKAEEEERLRTPCG